MASGHANRAQRPNTWLHRPSLRREDSSCQLGAVHTWHKADMRDSIMLRVVNSLAIEPAIRSRPNPGDADYESAKDHRGNQCLADPIALPQTKQGCAHGDYAEKLQKTV